MSGQDTSQVLGQALVGFTTNGVFPEDHVSSLKLTPEELPQAIEALAQAKSNLKAEIHTINTETAPSIATWKAHATSLQDDIRRSRHLANTILRQASSPETTVDDAAARVAFLQSELAYNARVHTALSAVRNVRNLLDAAETACAARHIAEALQLLEQAAAALAGKWAVRALEGKTAGLRARVYGVVQEAWAQLVRVVDEDEEGARVVVGAGEQMAALEDVVVGLRTFKEVDQRMAHFWHELDQAIVGPRMDRESTAAAALPAIVVEDDALCVKKKDGEADRTIDALFADLDTVFTYLATRLPPELLDSLSALMMPQIISRIISDWLDAQVPASLQAMDRFEHVMASARQFCARLAELNLVGFNELQEWVDDAPKVWLAKCRETALDTVRVRLSAGLGAPTQVERVEKQMVSRAEGQGLAQAPATAAVATEEDDWGAAWDVEDEGDEQQPQQQQKEAVAAEEEEDGADAWGWGDEGGGVQEEEQEPKKEQEPQQEDNDDGGDAWGWGDEDTQAQEPSAAAPAAMPGQVEQREMTLKETYNISSMPEPVLQLVFAILEDGATLTQAGHENSPVAKAAAGLFSLPTLALAMFRAVGPYYYSLDNGGNMFLYNDATYLAEKLAAFATNWQHHRPDLTVQAQKSLRLDNDIATLHKFAARAYSNELALQKTILRDLLGGGGGSLQSLSVDAAVARVRSLAATWDAILAKSAWYQAVGGLVDTISLKILADVLDAASISQDDAYSIAKLIAAVTELDDLFIVAADKAPQTMAYAPSWMRLKYLSEVLQSNLRDVRFLWMESELSLFFSVDEVVELIRLSFEDNARTREVLREITSHPHPRQQDGEGEDAW